MLSALTFLPLFGEIYQINSYYLLENKILMAVEYIFKLAQFSLRSATLATLSSTVLSAASPPSKGAA